PVTGGNPDLACPGGPGDDRHRRGAHGAGATGPRRRGVQSDPGGQGGAGAVGAASAGQMMTEFTAECVRRMETDGFAIIPDLLSSTEVDAILSGLEAALGDPAREGAISTQEGTVYAARNVLSLWPAVAEVWRSPPLPEVLVALLGPHFGLVRVLYFDKPPQ